MSGISGGPPYGQEPGEPPSYEPYGTNPYSTNPYGGAPASPYGSPGAGAGRGTDPVSITGFVLSLLCCTSVVGLILGIVGLSRTKGGQRGGRWAAIAATAIGAVGTLVFVGMIGFITWFGTSTVRLESADTGQCVNVDAFSSSHDATLFKRDCDEPHDAEIVVVDEFDRDLLEAYETGNTAASVCRDLLSEEYDAAFATGDYDLGIVFEATDPSRDDAFICFLERANGQDLTEPIAD